ncbi:hypothetical protein HK098_007782 [Nowakowskiella sp. JEL0407]|nr:hypothetical protein HK098_007782 [Nowakowskiella sp. JEL0407]
MSSSRKYQNETTLKRSGSSNSRTGGYEGGFEDMLSELDSLSRRPPPPRKNGSSGVPSLSRRREDNFNNNNEGRNDSDFSKKSYENLQTKMQILTSASLPRGSSLRSRGSTKNNQPSFGTTESASSSEKSLHRSRSNPQLASPTEFEPPQLPSTLGRQPQKKDWFPPVDVTTPFAPVKRNRSNSRGRSEKPSDALPTAVSSASSSQPYSALSARFQLDTNNNDLSLLSQSPTFRSRLKEFGTNNNDSSNSNSSGATLANIPPRKGSHARQASEAKSDQKTDFSDSLSQSDKSGSRTPNHKTNASVTPEDVTNILGGMSSSVTAAISFGAQYINGRKNEKTRVPPSTGSAGSTAYDLLADDMLMQVAVQECVVDSKRFQILSSEKYDAQKKELGELNSEISNLHNRLTVENRIKEAALQLAKLQNANKEQSVAAQEQLSHASKRVDAISTDLWNATGKVMEVERSVLKHIAAILRTEVLKKSDSSSDRKDVEALKKQMSSTEIKCKEQEQMITVLKSTINRVQEESEGGQREIITLRDENDLLNRRIKKLERMLSDSETEKTELLNNSQPSDYNQTKLELESSRAEVELVKMDLEQERNTLANLRLQLDEDQALLEEKDRTISDLLSELEELQTKMEMDQHRNSSQNLNGDSNLVNQLQSRVRELEQEIELNPKKNRSSYIKAREQIAEDSEKRKSVFGAQLKDAIMERERLKSENQDQKERINELERRLEGMVDSSVANENKEANAQQQSRIKQLETQLNNATKDTQDLKKLYININSNSPSLKTTTASDMFNIPLFIDKVNTLISEKENLSKKLKETEDALESQISDISTQLTELERSTSESKSTSARQIRTLESETLRLKSSLSDSEAIIRATKDREKELSDELKSTRSALEKNKVELDSLKSRIREFELMDKSYESSHRKLGEELRLAHRSELNQLRAEMERDIAQIKSEKDLIESRLVEINGTAEKLRQKVFVLEKDYGDVCVDRDNAIEETQRIELDLQSHIKALESKHQDAVQTLMRDHQRELERVNTDTLREMQLKTLEFEATVDARLAEREKKYNQQIDALKFQYAKQMDKLVDDAAKERKNIQTEAEARFKEKSDEYERLMQAELESAKQTHQTEIQNMRSEFAKRLDAEVMRVLDEKDQTISEFDNQLKEALQNQHSLHQNELEIMRLQLESELNQTLAANEQTQNELIARVNRAETSLVQSRSQFFEDKERMQEAMDELELEVRNLKQKEVDQFNINGAKFREYENATGQLRFEIQSLQTQIEDHRLEIERKTKEVAEVERKFNTQAKEMELNFNLQVTQLRNQLAEYEGIKSELDNIEIEFNQKISRKDQDLRVSETKITELNETIDALNKQMEAMKSQLERSKLEVEEVRKLRPQSTYRANEQNLVMELERMQMQVVEMKTQKVELLEELDDQHHREQVMQNELNNLRRDYDRVNRNVIDWETERAKLDKVIASQRNEIKTLQSKTHDKIIDRVLAPSSTSDSASPNIQKIRADFRKQLSDLRDEYSNQVDKEIQARQQLEAEIRKMKREKEMVEYSRVGQGTQTMLKWTQGEMPTKMLGF